MPDEGGWRGSFFKILTDAVADFTEHGFDSQDRLDFWLHRIRAAAELELIPEVQMQAKLREALTTVYRRAVDRGGIMRLHPGISRFTLEHVKPKLRDELTRRIMASANLIKLNRQEAIEKTLRRFSGWATSIPTGGSEAVERGPVKGNIRKSLASLPFEERRVSIDQGAKFLANLSDILATDGGALAGIWRSRWRVPNYNYREDHKERDGLVYTIRGNWALERGLMKSGPAGYTDEITKPAEEVFCSCSYTWLHALRDLPPDMLTVDGKIELERVRAAA